VGRRLGNSRSVVADEWGEPGKPEAEPPAPADPPSPGIDDEWEEEQPAPAEESGPQTDEAAERREELKRCLVDTVYGSELGFRASTEVRGELVELVTQLEAANPTPAPIEAAIGSSCAFLTCLPVIFVWLLAIDQWMWVNS
jgi:hypothetical protein